MKNLLLIVFMLATSLTFASFPVNRENVSQERVAHENLDVQNYKDTSMMEVSENVAKEETLTPIAAASYDKWVAAALWLVLWPFAAHRWYARKPLWVNILFILTLGGLGVWAIVDIINILTDNF
ncbi:MAG: TM2 domain-containing protein [Psychroflexus sp.]|nr:TM2 domain-containing protein [Psychroflexus sp.]MDN6310889.1 TM2 domain-containing protein [Psychroflexus sp.]